MFRCLLRTLERHTSVNVLLFVSSFNTGGGKGVVVKRYLLVILPGNVCHTMSSYSQKLLRCEVNLICQENPLKLAELLMMKIDLGV